MHVTNVLKIRKRRNIYATKIFVLLIIPNFSVVSMRLSFSNNEKNHINTQKQSLIWFFYTQ